MHKAVINQEDLQRLLKAEFPETFNPDTGLVILEIRHGGCRVRQGFLENSLRPGGTISGTTMMRLADVSVYVAVLASIGWTPLAVTTSLNINFPSEAGRPPQRKPNADFWKSAGSSRLKVSIRSEGEEGLVAHATCTYSIPPRS